ncbi:MAG: hypothetical protein MUE87_01695 [Methanothrix sp.]|nr:hypothetical protein [Methanothrix sp.]
MIGNKIFKIATVLALILLLAALAGAQMNRDTPFLASKLPRTEDSIIGQSSQPVSTFVVSEPLNSQAVSDLFLSADQNNTTCSQVSFAITLTASPSGSAGYLPVKVRVIENRLGTPTSVAELTVLMPVGGGLLHETIGFASAASSSGGSQANEITLYVDPDSQVAETDERNNVLVVSGICRD